MPSDTSTTVFGALAQRQTLHHVRSDSTDSRVRLRTSANMARASFASWLRHAAISSGVLIAGTFTVEHFRDRLLVAALERQRLGDAHAVRTMVRLRQADDVAQHRLDERVVCREIDLQACARNRRKTDAVGWTQPPDELDGRIHGGLAPSGADIALIDEQQDQPSTGCAGVRAVIGGCGDRALRPARPR